ncbi:hypothetical protein [Phenylobacterium sp.]|uniref:hypothetical protein n=1 Tax=Phenylobacterium sp. TaxID=1871053 RepID=UPI00286C8094|nr:hypothetical protein [Phenylobacterium sp.]
MPTRRAAGLMALSVLYACAPAAPNGVDPDRLDAAVGQAIGDPASCLLIAEAPSGRVVYRYNTHTACARALPACDAPGTRTLDGLLEATARDGQPRALSCSTTADASRGVGWASGAIAAKSGGKRLVYAAMMEGDRALPGRMMSERLATAFRRAGL